MTKSVAIVDSGANYASVCGALDRLGASYTITADPGQIRRARRVLLPGVGHVADTLTRLRAKNLPDVLRGLGQPLLGICVGMQVLYDYCEEADDDGLGLIDGRVEKLRNGPGLRVPHCGWNEIRVDSDHPLTDGLNGAAESWAYFVHSYAAPVGMDTVASTEHGEIFTAIAARENIFGVQFHPERSAATGRALLSAFLSL